MRKVLFSAAQVTGGLDLHPIGVAGIVGQRYILHLDDLHRLSDGAGLNSHVNGFRLGLFGLDKLKDVPASLARLEAAFDQVF